MSANVCTVCLELFEFCSCDDTAKVIPPAIRIAFENEHLSVSRLKLFEQCPLAFYFRYIDKGETAPRGNAADFGVVLHATLEELYAWVKETKLVGRIPESKVVELYRTCWQATKLTGVALYEEGLGILRTYLKSHTNVDHAKILDVEKEFNIDVGGFVINGYIDRVDLIGDGHVAIIDYKSNRALFTKDELETDLQMSIYGLAVRVLYPWVKRVSFVFEMLRHDTVQGAERTAQQIDDAAGYVVALGNRTEDPLQEFKPTINLNCSYCDHRARCAEYRRMVEGKLAPARTPIGAALAEVIAERETLAKIVKAMYARKGELDDVIKKRIGEVGEFSEAGFRYRFIDNFSRTWDSALAVASAFAAAGYRVEPDRIVSVDKEKLEALRVEAVTTLDRPKAMILNATIESLATKKAGTPRLDSTEIKKHKKASDDDAATGNTKKRKRATKAVGGSDG